MTTTGFFIFYGIISVITCYLLSVVGRITGEPEKNMGWVQCAFWATLWPIGLPIVLAELWRIMEGSTVEGKGNLSHTIHFPARVGDIVVVSEESKSTGFRKVGIIDWMEADVRVHTRTSPEGRTGEIRLHLRTLEGDDKFNLAVSKNTRVRILKQE